MGKWIGIIVGLALVLGVVGVVAVKTGWFATAKEAGDAWMDEQQLKNFPALARKGLADMETRLADTEKTRSKVRKNIGMYKGTDNMTREQLTDEQGGYATIKGYELLKKEKDEFIAAREKAIKSVVAEVKKQQDDLIAASGGAISKKEEIDAKQVYTISKPNGGTQEMTLAAARELTGKLAKEMDAAKKEQERYTKRHTRLTELVAKLEKTMGSLDTAIDAQKTKIDDMKVMITDMEAELKLLEIEKDIASINAAIEGKDSDSEFGKLIGKFKKAQKEWAVEQTMVEEKGTTAEKGVSTSDFMGTDSTGGGSSSGADDYWK